MVFLRYVDMSVNSNLDCIIIYSITLPHKRIVFFLPEKYKLSDIKKKPLT